MWIYIGWINTHIKEKGRFIYTYYLQQRHLILQTLLPPPRYSHSIFFFVVFSCLRSVMSITTFKTVEEGLALANDSDFGLAAAAFTENKDLQKRCASELRAGVTWINNA